MIVVGKPSGLCISQASEITVVALTGRKGLAVGSPFPLQLRSASVYGTEILGI